MITLPKDYKDYDKINARKTTLETLVGYIKVIQRQDSLQKIAKMSEPDRDKFIENLIKKSKKIFLDNFIYKYYKKFYLFLYYVKIKNYTKSIRFK